MWYDLHVVFQNIVLLFGINFPRLYEFLENAHYSSGTSN